jgi:hypothetical protein
MEMTGQSSNDGLLKLGFGMVASEGPVPTQSVGVVENCWNNCSAEGCLELPFQA